MTKNRIHGKLKLPNVLIILSIIFLSCALLIFINYFTIKILSATRAYVNGESHYSKGQKDAVRHLITYLYTEDKAQWELYKEELSVPKGDGAARIALTNHYDDSIAKNGLRAGRNHEKDLDALIWVFKNFQAVPFFKKAVGEWKQADAYITQMDALGNAVHQKMTTTSLDEASRRKFLSQISTISDKLTVNEREFSNTLGQGTREIKDYLIYANIIFVLIIISSVGIYFSMTVKKLLLTKHEIENKNNDLLLANKELDKFVYSASHDLRSPITSMQGLIEILKQEDDPEQVRSYLNMMQQVLSKQDQFIGDIIDYSRNKRTKIINEPVSLNEIIEDAIAQHQYIEVANGITINKEVAVDKLFSDNLRLRIIVNNLVSNAVKYADLSKEKPFISIKTYDLNKHFAIEIEDNGIGISEEFQSRIFEMFFVTDNNKGTGLGLYIVKEAVENMNGNITVASKNTIGTKFTVTIPYQNET